MKRLALFAVLCLMSAVAQAKGVPFALESLEKAQQVSQKDTSKHVLVFYTSEN